MTEPITCDWPLEANHLELAQSICDQLAQLEVSQVPADLIPLLAEAANELAEVVGAGWRVNVECAPVAMIRGIARATAIDPSAGGPKSAALLSRLLA